MSAPPARPRRRTRAAGPKPESESAFQQTVVNLAIYTRWRPFHAPDGGHSGGKLARGQIRTGFGFPDLLLIRPPRLIVAELKAEKTSARVTVAECEKRPDWLAHRDLTEDQALWLGLFGELAQVEAYIWRPSDISDIRRILAPSNQGAFA